MIKTDYHIHTTFSHDGKSTMEDFIIKALEMGFTELCFTEHYDVYEKVLDSNVQTIDVDKYKAKFDEMKAKYGDMINLKFGIEIGLSPTIKTEVKELVEKHDFDFIIGSSHVVNEIDIGLNPKAFFTDSDVEDTYSRYLESVLENIKTFDEFNVYGHLDYIIRYSDEEYKYLDVNKHNDLITEILTTLISKEKGIEINTSGFKYGLGATHPNYEIIKKYAELGGNIITVGSDAHTTEHLGDHFNEVETILNELNINEISRFEKRKKL